MSRTGAVVLRSQIGGLFLMSRIVVLSINWTRMDDQEQHWHLHHGVLLTHIQREE